MIILVGDTHGIFYVFERLMSILPDPQIKGEDITVIHVGDFGIWPGWQERWNITPWPVYFIDGNHEDFRIIKRWNDSVDNRKQPIEIDANLFYLPRGTIMNLEGKTFGFMGGGDSIDYKWRTLGENWFLEERVQQEDIDLLFDKKIDVLVTHVPPISMAQQAFPPFILAEWGLSEWDDVSMKRIDELWNELGKPELYCGHMHKKVQWQTCRTLSENECFVYGDTGRSVWK